MQVLARRVQFLRPLAMLSGLVLLLSVVGIIYLYTNGLGVRRLLVQVIYQPGYLQVTASPTLDYNTSGGLIAGDRIVRIDRWPVEDFLAKEKSYLVEVSPPTFTMTAQLGRFYDWPLQAGESIYLTGLRAQTLEVERPTGNFSLNLDTLNSNRRTQFTIHFLLLIALIFLASCSFLFFWRPATRLTFCLCSLFNLLGLYLLAQSNNSSNFVELPSFLVTVGFTCLYPVLSLWLVVIYPDSHIGSWWGRATLIILTITGFCLFAATLAVNINRELFSPNALNFITTCRLIWLALLAVLSIAVIIGRLVKSRDAERVRVRLILAAFLMVSLPPTLVFVGYNLFRLFDWLYTAQNAYLLLVPTVILPPILIYAALKDDLYRIDQLVRSSLVYLLLVYILSLSFLVVSGLVFYIYQELTGTTRRELDLLVFLLLLLCTNEIKNLCYKIVNGLFYRNEPDYINLLKKWSQLLNGEVIELEALLNSIVHQLAQDFKLERVEILIARINLEVEDWNTVPAHSPFNSARQPVAIIAGAQPGQSQLLTSNVSLSANTNRLQLLLNWAELKEIMLVEQEIRRDEFEEWFNGEYEIINWLISSKPSKTIRQDYLQPQHYQFLLPFPHLGHVTGGLLIGRKLSGQLSSPDERSALAVITQQVGNSLNTALRIQEEAVLRQIMQTLAINQENARLEERKKIAMELHDTIKQRMSFIDSQLNSWLLDNTDAGEPLENVDTETHKMLANLQDNSNQLLGQVKVLLGQLSLGTLPGGLLPNIRRLVNEEAARNPNRLIKLILQPGLQRTDLEWLTEEETTFLFRVAQEAITNALKHSECTKLEVCLEVNKLSEECGLIMVMTIKDNGKGFCTSLENLHELILKKHFGLLHMRERVEYIGGKFELASSGTGTQIKVQLSGR
jgi:signal transduction histidine kinase